MPREGRKKRDQSSTLLFFWGVTQGRDGGGDRVLYLHSLLRKRGKKGGERRERDYPNPPQSLPPGGGERNFRRGGESAVFWPRGRRGGERGRKQDWTAFLPPRGRLLGERRGASFHRRLGAEKGRKRDGEVPAISAILGRKKYNWKERKEG